MVRGGPLRPVGNVANGSAIRLYNLLLLRQELAILSWGVRHCNSRGSMVALVEYQAALNDGISTQERTKNDETAM